jgi:tetratricopeptide (TPR) repeat protein
LAIKVATTGLKELPHSYELYSSRAAAYALQGKQPEAMADYRAAIRLQPRRADDYFSLALIQYHQGNYAAAAQTLKAPIQGGFADSDIHYLLAECMRAQHGAVDAALKEVTLALQMDPASAPALTLRGQLELQQGDVAAAVRDLTRARSIDPQSKEVAYNLARAYQKAGQRQKAQALFQQVQAESQDLNAALQQKKMVQILVERPAQP